MSVLVAIFAVTSLAKICDNKCRVTFSEHDSEITKDGKVIGIRYRQKDKNKAKAPKTEHETRKEQEIEAEGVHIINGPTLTHFIGPVTTLAIPSKLIGYETWHLIQRLKYDELKIVMIEGSRLKIRERLNALDPSLPHYKRRPPHIEEGV
ncbi:hypothetical protein Tco_0814150 [Tanacetum coccineum]